MKDIIAVLKLLLLPKECYHCYLERYLERDGVGIERVPCNDSCSYCCRKAKEIPNITLPFARTSMQNVLMSHIFDNGQISLAEFTKRMTTHAPKLYNHDTNIIKQLQPGHIHALCLQLVASGIVEVTVSDHTLFGSDNLLKTNLRVKFGKDKDGTLKALSPMAFEDFQM